MDRRLFVVGAGAMAAGAGQEGAATAIAPAASAGGGRMNRSRAGVLDVAYLESGPADGAPVILLHGFPYDVHSYAEVSARLAAAGRRVIVPYLRGYGPTRFLDPATPRVGQQVALGTDLLELLDALGIARATLAGYDWGGRAACVVAALHPDRVVGLVSGGTGYNIQNSTAASDPVNPAVEHRHWYWFYIDSGRGKAALEFDRIAYCRYLWKTFSPTWRFDEETYLRTGASFDNPDFVEVVRHSYRYRIGAVPGDPALDTVERKLAQSPAITVPTIILEGAADGVDPPTAPAETAPHFTALRRQTILPSIGHNVPQEAPTLFADAVLELAR